uniref:Uncharacterized protein n=1 Tax=Anopheles stephensi TaxID=30069 RepID=A0A182YFS9_ANOST
MKFQLKIFYSKQANEYASYQNTLGRRSTLVGPYTHMSKYSYPTDVSLSSHYGYTSWGLWRDSRNLSSSLYAKKQKNIKSFSILLMSAAFIVVLAVLCVAGLAFYFSTFKADLSETILAFDCTFRVARGDIYTTGLRTNSTPVYRQKTAFYEKLIETSLERSGLTVSRTEIMNFGDGPTIALSFRVFLDMRKIKITINNVEEHIRTAFLSEVLNPNSAFKNIRIDPDSIEIKRLLDQEVLKTALLTRNEPFPSVVKPSGGGGAGSDQEQRHVTKKTGVIEKTIHKFTPRVTPVPPTGSRTSVDGSKGIVEAESDIDMDNLPVIQGSFEITKTDADITQKRAGGGGGGGGSTDPAGRVPAVASTLKPFAVSPAQITVRGSEKTRVTESIKGTDEKPSTGGQGPPGRFGQNPVGGKSKYETATAKIEKMDKHGATTKKIKTTSLKPSSGTGGSGAGRRSTTANGMVGRTTTTTTRSPTTTTTSTTTTTTTTTTTMAPSLAVRSTSAVSGKIPTQVASTTSRLTTLRYQVLASQGSSNEPSSMSGSASVGAWDEEDDSDEEELPEESFAEDHLPVVVDVIGLPSETDGDIKNDTLLETIFQAIINDSIPEEFASDRRRVGGLEPDSIPKLDVNLFTSAPILDKQPWHPINPNQQQQVKADQRTGLPARKKVSLAEEILYRNRPSDIESVLAYTENPNGQIYYQSYTNPSFGSSTLGIEPLGVSDVRPYPLPVDKIHEEVIPDFKYLTPTAVDASEQLLNLTLDEQKFEHLGDGVIAKKPEQTSPPDGEPITTTEKLDTVTLQTPMSGSSGESQSSDETSTEVYGYYSGPTEGLDSVLSNGGTNGTHDDELVDVAMDLESRNSPDDSEQVTTTAGPAITTTMGVSELNEDGMEQLSTTMQSTTLSSSEEIHSAEDLLMSSTTTETMSSSSEEITASSAEVTLTPVHITHAGQSKPPTATYVEVETLKYTPSTTLAPPTTNTLPELFPITKWEFVNGTRRTTAEKPPTKKVFNETLQALVVVNVQPDGTTALPRTPPQNIEDLKSNRPNATNLQNLSDIFDTLASKLGIQPEVSSKMPPFSSLSKIKNQYRNSVNRTGGTGTARPRTTTTVRPKRKKTRPTVTKIPSTSTVGYRPSAVTEQRVRVSSTTELYPETTPMARVIPTVINDEIDDVVPVMLETSSELSSELAVVGQAEVEVIDPNRYEEMLNSMSLAHGRLSVATTTPSPLPSTLVTLLPVKSNSGIRNFRPKTKRPPPYGATTGAPAAHNHGDKNESRKMNEAGLKLMNANKTEDDDRPAAGPAQHHQRPASAERVEPLVAQQGSNKNNTMVETVVRASMRFES